MIPSTQGEDKGTAADTTATHRAPDATAARAESSAPPAESAFDSRAAQDVLALLREWGWSAGWPKSKRRLRRRKVRGRRRCRCCSAGWPGSAATTTRRRASCKRERRRRRWRRGAGRSGRGGAAERRLTAARTFLDRAEAAAGDAGLRATTAHLRGAVALHEGRHAEALTWLHAALEGFASSTAARGRSEGLHFGAGRVLDTLGMVHAARNNFPTASAFYTESLAVKRRHRDDAGLALTHGQLGRLMLDWDRLDEADAYFRDGLAISRRIGDEHGEAVLHNQRGRVLLARPAGRSQAAPGGESPRRAGPLARRRGVRPEGPGAGLAGSGPAGGGRGPGAGGGDAVSVSFHRGRAFSRPGGVGSDPSGAGAAGGRGAGWRTRPAASSARANTPTPPGRCGSWRDAPRAVPGRAALLGALDEAERGRRDHLRAPIERELREASEIDWARRSSPPHAGRRRDGDARRRRP